MNMYVLDAILDFGQKYQKFIVGFFMLLAACSLVDKALAVAFLLFVFLCAITLLVIQKQKEDAKILWHLFIVVFLFHAIIVAFLYYTGFQPFSGGDYTFYDGIAREVVERVHQGDFSLGWVDTGNLYPVIVGYLYLLTMPSMLMGQLLNAWMVSMVAVILYLIVREMGGLKKQGFIAGIIVALYPSLIFFGSLLLKDALVALLSVFGLLLTIKLVKNFSWLIFGILYVTLMLLTNIRFYASFAVILAFMICWFFLSGFEVKKRMLYGFCMILLLGFIPHITGHGYLGKNIISELLNPSKITFYREKVYAPPIQPPPPLKERGNSEDAPVAPLVAPQIETSQIDTSKRGAGSSFVIKTGIENPLSFVKNSFISFLHVFLGPFPWQIKHARQAFVLPEMVAWYVLLFFIGRGILLNIKKQYKAMLPLIIFSVIILGVMAVYTGNFGIAVRIRMPAFIVLLCLASLGLGKIENIKIPLLGPLLKKYL